MNIQKTAKAQVNEHTKEMLAAIAPKVGPLTQFVLKGEDTTNFGHSKRDGELVVQMANSESVKTTGFETDGTYKDGNAINFKDGHVRHRHITGWNWVIVENLVKGSTGEGKVTQTCYVRDKMLYLQLRLAVGHKGF